MGNDNKSKTKLLQLARTGKIDLKQVLTRPISTLQIILINDDELRFETDVPWDKCTMRQMYHETNVPWDKCTVRQIYQI